MRACIGSVSVFDFGNVLRHKWFYQIEKGERKKVRKSKREDRISVRGIKGYLRNDTFI